MEEICPRFPVSKALSLPGMMTSAVRMAMGFLLGVGVGRDGIVVEGVQIGQPPVVSSLAEQGGAWRASSSSTCARPSGTGAAPPATRLCWTRPIRDLSLTVPDGKTMVVLGPSGCGKTTLLKLIAGLITPDAGRERNDGVDVSDVAPGARRIGMVFQNYALYPHFTSRTNVLSDFLFRKKSPE